MVLHPSHFASAVHWEATAVQKVLSLLNSALRVLVACILLFTKQQTSVIAQAVVLEATALMQERHALCVLLALTPRWMLRTILHFVFLVHLGKPLQEKE